MCSARRFETEGTSQFRNFLSFSLGGSPGWSGFGSLTILATSSERQPAMIPDLSAKDIANQTAGAFHFRHQQRAINTAVLSSRTDNAGRLQDADMLRKIGFGDFQFRLEICCKPVTLSEQIENLKSGRIRKGLADTGLTFKHLGLDAVACGTVSDGHSHPTWRRPEHHPFDRGELAANSRLRSSFLRCILPHHTAVTYVTSAGDAMQAKTTKGVPGRLPIHSLILLTITQTASEMIPSVLSSR